MIIDTAAATSKLLDHPGINERTRTNLQDVHVDLKLLVRATAQSLEGTDYGIIVTEGLRTMRRQQELLKAKKSSTLNSRHLTGHAFDFAVTVAGQVTWEMEHYRAVAGIIKDLAAANNVHITWGGDWNHFLDGKVDGTHIELSWKYYPIEGKPAKKVSNSKTVIAAATAPVAAAVPEIVSAITEGSVDLASITITQWLSLAVVAIIGGFIAIERIRKMRREGV